MIHSINIPTEKVKVLIRILEIAHKPHKHNYSPVHIVEELKEIAEADIVELKNKLSELT